MVWQASGVMVKAWCAPQLTVTEPLGEIEPPLPALAAMANVLTAKLAAIVWPAVTLVKVWLVTAPAETPSTITSAMVWQASGVIVKAWSEPQLTVTAPAGLMEPPAAALAVMVSVLIAKLAAMV